MGASGRRGDVGGGARIGALFNLIGHLICHLIGNVHLM